MTQLRAWTHPKTGRVHRVYVKRPGLRGKIWFEKSKVWDTGFDVRVDNRDGSFSAVTMSGDAPHIVEARAALAELGLEMSNCTWSDIVEAARSERSASASLLQTISRYLPFFRYRHAS